MARRRGGAVGGGSGGGVFFGEAAYFGGEAAHSFEKLIENREGWVIIEGWYVFLLLFLGWTD